MLKPVELLFRFCGISIPECEEGWKKVGATDGTEVLFAGGVLVALELIVTRELLQGKLSLRATVKLTRVLDTERTGMGNG